MDALRAKSSLLSGYLEFLVDRIIASPAAPGGSSSSRRGRPSARGCQLSLRVRERPRELFTSLERRGVVGDFREPDVIRVAPVPLYNSFHDVWRCRADPRRVLERRVSASRAQVHRRRGRPRRCAHGDRISGAQATRSRSSSAGPIRARARRSRGARSTSPSRRAASTRSRASASPTTSCASPSRCEGRMIHPVDGDLHFQPYGTENGQAINSVSRAGLNMALVEAAEKQPHVRVRFGVKCRAVDLDDAAVELVDVETGERAARARRRDHRRRRRVLRGAPRDAATRTDSITRRSISITVTRSWRFRRATAAGSAWSRTRCTSGRAAGS